MDRTDFMAQAPGKLVLIRRGEYGVAEATLAFVPNPLPETLSLSMTTIRLLEDARGALGELAGTGQWLGSPNLLIRPFVRREAISSSTIEGTITTMEQLSLFEARPTEEQSETSEVANYTAAMEHGLGRLDTLPVSLRMFRELHEKLMTNVRGEEHIAGEFRQRAVVIGEHGAPVSTARFVPPPPVEMQ
jgi:Fic family protein